MTTYGTPPWDTWNDGVGSSPLAASPPPLSPGDVDPSLGDVDPSLAGTRQFARLNWVRLRESW